MKKLLINERVVNLETTSGTFRLNVCDTLNDIRATTLKVENPEIKSMGAFLSNVSSALCDNLGIALPYVNVATVQSRIGGSLASCTCPTEYKSYGLDVHEMDRPIVQFANIYNRSPQKILGLWAHEFRHAWQDKYATELLMEGKSDYGARVTDDEYLSLPSEIDADGYAIAVISHACDISIEDAADIYLSARAFDTSNWKVVREKWVAKAYELVADVKTMPRMEQLLSATNVDKIRDRLHNLF